MTFSDRSTLFHLEGRLRHTQQNARLVPTLSFDIDGVLANHIYGVLTHSFDSSTMFWPDWKLQNCSGIACTGCQSPVCFSAAAGHQSTRFERPQDSALLQQNFWYHLKPFDETEIRNLGSLLDSGRFAAVFISNRGDNPIQDPIFGDSRIDTINWLRHYEIENYLAVDAHCEDKLASCLYHKVDYHLDDDADEVSRLRAAGVQAFLMTRPWNIGIPCEYRVEGLQQFLDIAAPGRSREDDLEMIESGVL